VIAFLLLFEEATWLRSKTKRDEKKKRSCKNKNHFTIGLKGPIPLSIALVAWAGCSKVKDNS
jgi:hypothetical protein